MDFLIFFCNHFGRLIFAFTRKGRKLTDKALYGTLSASFGFSIVMSGNWPLFRIFPKPNKPEKDLKAA